MKANFERATNNFVYRRPVGSLPELREIDSRIGFNPDYEKCILNHFKNNPELDALMLASPSLYQEYVDLKDNGHAYSEKKRNSVLASLYRYILRSHTKCTPFGLFSGVGLGRISAGPMTLMPLSHQDAHLRLDTEFLSWLAERISREEGIRGRLKYYVTPTFYKTEKHIKYYEYDISAVLYKRYFLSRIGLNDCLEYLTEACVVGKELNTLITEIVTLLGYEEEEVKHFLDELIENKFLINELAPNVVGEPYFDRICKVVAGIDGAGHHGEDLSFLQNALTGAHTLTTRAGLIRQRFPGYAGKNILQADLISGNSESNLNDAFIDEVINNVNSIAHLLIKQKDASSLDTFKNAFVSRFGDNEIPLNIALDPEEGVGFGSLIHGIESSLIDGLPNRGVMGSDDSTRLVSWRHLDDVLLRKAIACKTGDSIVLDDKDIVTGDRKDNVGKSCFLFGSYAEPGGEPGFHFGFIDGPPATRLLGRFCYGNGQLKNLATALHKMEEQEDEDCLFAELVYIAQDRAGNILNRPQLRGFEIQILGSSTGDEPSRIPLNDILVSVRNNRIILRSKRLGKRIIPRESSAFSPAFNNIPAYLFLTYVQLQEAGDMLIFELPDHFQRLPYFPRIAYKRLVLSLARWRIAAEDITDLLNRPVTAETCEILRERFRLPASARLIHDSSRLTLNFNNIMSLELLFQVARKEKVVILEEELLATGEGLHSSIPRNEIIIPLINFSRPKYTTVSGHTPPNMLRDTKRFPGSDYLYLKFYVNSTNSDALLHDLIGPWLRSLKEKGTIDGFFFIRYVDYTFHLRVRVFSSNMATAMFPVLSSLEERIGLFYENSLLEDFYIAPYEQETSLYKEHVRLAEGLFYIDSDAVLSLIDKYGKSLDNDQLLLNLLVSGINDIFRLFDVPENRIIYITDTLSRNFIAEFGDSKDLKQRLQERSRPLLKSIGSHGTDEATREIFNTRYTLMHRQLQGYTKEHAPLDNTFVEYFVGRLIHLYVNRLCPNDPRKHELILYFTLNKYYIGRQQQKLPVLKF